MKLNILMATMNEGSAGLLQRVSAIDARARVVVCRQITKQTLIEGDLAKELMSARGDIVVIEKEERGLSKSRNVAIRAADRGSICLVADDDVYFEPNMFDSIAEAYEAYPDADIITFAAKTPEGEFFKNYAAAPFRHDIKSVAKVSSIEMTFRLDSIREAGLRFDERFGLGTEYPTGEEFIFLTDALKKGLKIYFYPKPLAVHPKESSGSFFTEKSMIGKGAMLSRVFGIKGYIVALLFVVKKYPKYKKNFGFFMALSLILQGVRSI